jgi:hypothetical protein
MSSWIVIDEGFSEPLSKRGVFILRVLPTGRFISTHLQMWPAIAFVPKMSQKGRS